METEYKLRTLWDTSLKRLLENETLVFAKSKDMDILKSIMVSHTGSSMYAEDRVFRRSLLNLNYFPTANLASNQRGGLRI